MRLPTQKLTFWEKICYGFGDLASVLYWQTFMLYFTFFYTDVFLIPASVAATMFLISRIWDGINDPIMGMIADRTKTRWGKFRPYLLWLCVPFAVVGVLTFTVPSLGPTGKIIWAYVTFNLIMMLYTAINIPYTALLGVISADSLERTTVSSVKFLFAFSAGIIVSATLLPMVKALGHNPSLNQIFGPPSDARGWQASFIIYGMMAVIFFLITFLGTRERVQPPKNQRSSVKQDLYELITNQPWLILLAITITFILFVAVRSSVTVHYFKYVIGTQELRLPFLESRNYGFEEITSAFNTVGQISAFIGVLGVSWVAKLLGKKRAFLLLFAIAIVSTAAFYFLTAKQLGLIFLFQILGSMTGGPLSVLLWAMYADTADYGEWKRGRRTTGLVFSASTMTQKIGWAFGAFVALSLMSRVGFEPNQAQSPESIRGLRLLFSLIPAGLGLLAFGLMWLYQLDEDKMKAIGAELIERRQARGE
ncbi:MAG: MFS transporter [candidate division KSB1 bacterium]|nr:MFS transporter [candidate division KSB1 bacterium]MDZ7333859.1 MFS transporter [candidate division KSB1 bacterium]MDZ7376878.1 MFS transporter [candidate division KSB1 bacterium]MDZ7399105.1 MFS transporter [candidate division KSB1 bacterium]